MFAKLFGQIFDSSIAEDYNCRRMFMDLLVLADSDGAVDMTQEAISRRTNVPIEQVCKYIDQLQLPDALSRSRAEQGRRLIPLDGGRGWGWQIVNYRHYRQIRDEEARRSYFRAAKRKQRKTVRKNVQDDSVDSGGPCQIVSSASSSKSLKKGDTRGKQIFPASLDTPAFRVVWEEWESHRREMKKPLTATSVKVQLAQFETWGPERSINAIQFTIRKGWQGLREDEPKTTSNGNNGKPKTSDFAL